MIITLRMQTPTCPKLQRLDCAYEARVFVSVCWQIFYTQNNSEPGTVRTTVVNQRNTP